MSQPQRPGGFSPADLGTGEQLLPKTEHPPFRPLVREVQGVPRCLCVPAENKKARQEVSAWGWEGLGGTWDEAQELGEGDSGLCDWLLPLLQLAV